MEVIRTYPASKEFTPREIYKHAHNKSKPLKDEAEGLVIEPVEVVFYKDFNSKGEEITFCSIVAKDGEHYITTSTIFNREFGNIVELFGNEEIAVKLLKPTGKGGRTFVSCELL